MTSQFTVDNEGVGASGLLTMAVDSSSGKDFTRLRLMQPGPGCRSGAEQRD